MFTKTTIALLLSAILVANVSADDCPFTAGDYTVRAFINKAGRVVVGGCENETDCLPADCNNVPATVSNNGPTCSVTIADCFSNAGVGGTLTLEYGNFDVTNNLFLADLVGPGGLIIDGSYTQNYLGWRLKDSSGGELGSVSGNLDPNRRNLRA
eukprot:scaffold1381_cov64-Cylindrotheca_fusiformis.AAC.4